MSRHARRGFTLLEVMVAMAILATSFVVMKMSSPSVRFSTSCGVTMSVKNTPSGSFCGLARSVGYSTNWAVSPEVTIALSQYMPVSGLKFSRSGVCLITDSLKANCEVPMSRRMALFRLTSNISVMRGMAMAIIVPMMMTTTIISSRVKPRSRMSALRRRGYGVMSSAVAGLASGPIDMIV